MQTVKQVADALGVSKTAVRNYMDDDFREQYVQTDEKGTIYITDEGAQKLEHLRRDVATRSKEEPQSPENNAANLALIEILKQQLSEKDKQLAEKDKQLAARDSQILNLTEALATTSSSLQAAQALNAADKQQLLLQQKEQEPESFGARLRYLITGKR